MLTSYSPSDGALTASVNAGQLAWIENKRVAENPCGGRHPLIVWAW